MHEVTPDAAVAAARLRRTQRALVVSHTAPDGDAIGSALGVAELISHLGGRATIVSRDPFPEPLTFLPGLSDVTIGSTLPDGFPEAFDLAVVLECPGLDRTGFATELTHLPILNIDHHVANDTYGEVNYLDPDAPAVGEMLLHVATAAGVALTPTLATCLYTALVTDTGDFRYSNATPRAFTAAAQLVAAGARPHEIAEELWGHTPARVVRLTAATLSTLELLAGGRLAVLWCDRAMLARTGAAPEDTENLINTARGIDGVEVAVLLKSFTDGIVRVSLRARSRIDVQALAARFGGGGHRAAAGCTMAGTLDEARERLLAALLPLLETTP